MAARGKILVIDDDPSFLEFVRIVLESNDYEVYSADNCNDGLLEMQKVKPDLVILDVMISYCLDGLNFTKKMHDDPEFRKMPLIIVSAIVDSEQMARSTKDELKYDYFMSKPISPKDLVSTVEKVIN